jgi:hypothetical protein
LLTRVGQGGDQIDDPTVIGQQAGALRAFRFEGQETHGSPSWPRGAPQEANWQPIIDQ